jgi:hypothetical protein
MRQASYMQKQNPAQKQWQLSAVAKGHHVRLRCTGTEKLPTTFPNTQHDYAYAWASALQYASSCILKNAQAQVSFYRDYRQIFCFN